VLFQILLEPLKRGLMRSLWGSHGFAWCSSYSHAIPMVPFLEPAHSPTASWTYVTRNLEVAGRYHHVQVAQQMNMLKSQQGWHQPTNVGSVKLFYVCLYQCYCKKNV
jgi:hypothetical protein